MKSAQLAVFQQEQHFKSINRVGNCDQNHTIQFYLYRVLITGIVRKQLYRNVICIRKEQASGKSLRQHKEEILREPHKLVKTCLTGV